MTKNMILMAIFGMITTLTISVLDFLYNTQYGQFLGICYFLLLIPINGVMGQEYFQNKRIELFLKKISERE